MKNVFYWKEVKRGLPEREDYFNLTVWDTDSIQMQVCFKDGKFYEADYEGVYYEIEDVTHWMILERPNDA